ncbi:MAG: alkaline phosphatase D family protein [Pseudomonadales bacterium]|jgi:alkaline phosphatase D|nr:alkaline phosphatase D family protein [Pseudomonadales bacterium]
MPPLDRRGFLAAASVAAAIGVSGCASTKDHRGTERFVHGVASGDPGPDRVVIWTRLDGATGAEALEWLVAREPGLRRVVRRGRVVADPSNDFCCKIDVDRLEPGTTYFYAFRIRDQCSAVGRTRTLARQGVENLRFAVAACANYQQGSFAAYDHIAGLESLDAVLHLGDYIYEYGDQSAGRLPIDPPHEILTLADYRRRYAFYRRDPALQACHREHPFIAVWDDHESANNAWRDGAGNHDPAREGAWSERRAAAIQAWREWMPVRDAASRSPIHRSFRFGDLADLVMLDTRLEGREQPLASPRDIAANPGRELLGSAQETWLLDELDASQARGTRWRLLGQQVVFAPLGNFNPDQWDGYPQARRRILEHMRRAGIDNVVILTGDIHSSWALDVAIDPYDPARYDRQSGRGAQAVEFVTPGIASEPLGNYLARRDPDAHARMVEAIPGQPHLRFADHANRGFVSLEVNVERVEASWHFVAAPTDPHSRVERAHRETVRAGENHLSRADETR